MDDLGLFEELVRLGREGFPCALATVIMASGSVPRRAGARMLVRADCSTVGTVGGGRVESAAIEAALAAIRDGTPRTLPLTLTEEHGLICGGSLTIYVEPFLPAAALVVFGAGHVGKALTALASRAGFRVTVVDCREELACTREIPEAARFVCRPVEKAFGELGIDGTTAVVVATPTHEEDFAAIRLALATPAGFIGMLGSVRKRTALVEALAAEGFVPAQIDRVTSPVGLPIGAETPAEIAVSIVAQLIANRRGRA